MQEKKFYIAGRFLSNDKTYYRVKYDLCKQERRRG